MAVKGIMQINDILDEYSNDIQEGIQEDAIRVSKEAVSELKNTSPKRTGDYRKGWRVQKDKGRGYISCIVHNATDYQLTHLLEKPHLTRNGKLTTPKVHIAPVESKAIKDYEREVENTIKNGG